MRQMIIVGAVVLGLGLCGVMAIAGTYNGLVGQDEVVKQGWSEVQNQFQRRADLIGNLVETVKGSAAFERETLEAVTNARASATRPELKVEGVPSASQLRQIQAAQGELSSALSRLLVTVEAYPQLQSVANFTNLMTQLEGTENRVTVARGRYNDAVRVYNVARRRFPTVLIANMMGFGDEYPMFEAAPGTDQAPKVDFGSGK